MFKQNSFSRSVANDQKMGAYFTDLEHCERIGNLFSFPNDEVCVLEPCIGDGSAVMAVTSKKSNPNIKIFGVELNDTTCKKIQDNEDIDYLLNADFLNGVKITHNSFSFCFSNPPYSIHLDSGKRFETLFIEKMFNYIYSGGLLTLVIPYYVLMDESFLKYFFARYLPIKQYRFDQDVFSQFKQIVVIAKRRESIGYLRDTYTDYVESINSLDKLPYLPQMNEEVEKIIVAPSYSQKIEYFTTLTFDAGAAAKSLHKSVLYQLMGDKMFVPTYCATELGNPPLPLKKDLLYLCAISGGGQGVAGSEETKDMHLQRGVAKVVKEVEEREVNGSLEIVEKSFTKIFLNVIENDGTITALE